MDLRLYARVVRRFWPLVSVGAALAILLSFVSIVRVDFGGGPHFAMRQRETWKGSETLLLTQHGFPWGRTVFPYVVNPKTGQLLPSESFADPSRFTTLAVVYSEIANGDTIHARVFGNREPDGSYSASPVVNSVGSPVLGAQPITQIVPLVRIDALATTPARALAVASRAGGALRSWVAQHQVQSGIPMQQRIVLQVVSTPAKATLAHGYRLTGPIVIFVGTLIAVLLLAFVLENLRPRGRRTEGDEQAPSEPPLEEPADSPSQPVPVGRNGTVTRLPLPAGADPSLPLGRVLRDTRMRRGIDLRRVEAETTIPTKHLRALESERLDLLPDDETARHALRAYAEHLQLDPDRWVADFGLGGEPVAASAPVRRRNGNLRALSLSVPMVVAAAAAAIALLMRDGSERPGAAPAAHGRTPAAARVLAVQRRAVTESSTRTATTANARLDVTATRGASWVVIRAGSAKGRVVFAGTLRRGDAVSRSGRRLWMELGAATNVDVTVDGTRPPVRLYGTLDAIVTSNGLRKVALGR